MLTPGESRDNLQVSTAFVDCVATTRAACKLAVIGYPLPYHSPTTHKKGRINYGKTNSLCAFASGERRNASDSDEDDNGAIHPANYRQSDFAGERDEIRGDLMNDLLIACIIAGVFFLFVIGIFIDGFIREWIAENNMRKSYTCKIDEIIAENWDI